jgi:integrative and conjugative element protein (TIGR02256 family)
MSAELDRALTLAPEARDSIRFHAFEGDRTLETGGALFGFESAGVIAVSAAVGPGANAIHEPRFFLRDLDHTRVAAAQIFESTGAQWIGEWHTHPNGQLEPSETDLTTYVRHLLDPELGLSAFVSIVVLFGSMRSEVELHCWCIEQLGTNFRVYKAELGEPRSDPRGRE